MICVKCVRGIREVCVCVCVCVFVWDIRVVDVEGIVAMTTPWRERDHTSNLQEPTQELG